MRKHTESIQVAVAYMKRKIYFQTNSNNSRNFQHPLKNSNYFPFLYLLVNWLLNKSFLSKPQLFTFFFFSLSLAKAVLPVNKFRKNEDDSYVMHQCFCVLLSSHINHIAILYYFLILRWAQVFALIPLQIPYFLSATYYYKTFTLPLCYLKF